MAFVKSKDVKGKVRVFNEFLEAKNAFEDRTADKDLRLSALNYIIRHKEISYVLRMLSELFKENNVEDHVYIDYAFATFPTKPRREEDFQDMFDMLKSENAYLRNAAISFLQEYGEEVKPFLDKLLKDPDKDIRIFALNILGDVRFDKSVDMLREFLEKGKDVNAIATAAEYLGEVGSEEDITLLESIKKDYKNEPYLAFCVDQAINKLKN